MALNPANSTVSVMPSVGGAALFMEDPARASRVRKGVSPTKEDERSAGIIMFNEVEVAVDNIISLYAVGN